jgi:hypothetical protein
MKGLNYGIAITFACALNACTEAQFKSINQSTKKGNGIVNGDTVPVVEVPEEEVDEVIQHFACQDPQGQENVNAKKALICHINGKGKGVEICISKNALAAHIGTHGGASGTHDYFGRCI